MMQNYGNTNGKSVQEKYIKFSRDKLPQILTILQNNLEV